MEHTCKEEYNNALKSQKQDTFISSNNVIALDSLHVMFGSTYWTSALHLILLRPSMFFPCHAVLQFTIEKNSDYYKTAKIAGFFNPSHMLTNIPHGSLLFNFPLTDQEIDSETNNDFDHNDPLDLFGCQLVPSSVDTQQNSGERSIQDSEAASSGGSENNGGTPRESVPGGSDDDDDNHTSDDTSSKKKRKKKTNRKSNTKKPTSAEFILDSDDSDEPMEPIFDADSLTAFHNMIPIFKALMRSCASFQVQNSDTDIHGRSLSTLDHRDVHGISCLFGRLITNPNIRSAACNMSFMSKADTMLDKFAKDHMEQMSKREKAEMLQLHDETLENLFGQEDHPTCEQAVANAVKILENEWQVLSDQVHNPSADQDDQIDMDLDIEEDVDMDIHFE
jgi:hypothetical protein